MQYRRLDHRYYFDLLGPKDAPVVCMTHAHAADSGMWADQVPALLNAGFQVLRLDMRGHGGTSAPPGDYTMEALAEDVVGALDVLGFERAHYVGLSIGGMIGQIVALRHRDRLRSLTICDTLPASPVVLRPLWRERLAKLTAAGSVAPLADEFMQRWVTDTFADRRPDRFRLLHRGICETTVAGYNGCAAAIQGFDVAGEVAAITTPTLVICGSDDPSTSSAENRKLAAQIPGARFEEIGATRHLPNVERPDVFNRLLLGWLASAAG